MRCCAYRGCSNNNQKCPELRFHAFPRDPALRSVWEDCCLPRANAIRYMCNQHFAQDSYNRKDVLLAVPTKKWKLNRDAVPVPCDPQEQTARECRLMTRKRKQVVDEAVFEYEAERRAQEDQLPSLTIPFDEEHSSTVSSMDDVYKYCRLCFQVTSERTELFTEEKEYPTHLKLLEDIFNIQLTYVEGLPSTACAGCIEKIEASSAFVTVVRSSQTSFLGMLGKNEAQGSVASSPLTVPMEEALVDTNTTNILYEVEAPTEPLTIIISDYEGPRLRELEEERILEPEKKAITCETCGRMISSRSLLRKHMLTHLPLEQRQALYVCEVCGSGYAFKSQLTAHSHTHREKRARKCKYCGKFYFCIHGHIKRVHLRLEDGMCHICGKEVKNLKSHMVRHKSARLPCRFCGKEFPRRAALRRHENIHTGIKFDCDYCEFSSTQKANTAVHMRKRHPVEYEEYQRKQKEQWYEQRVKEAV